MSPGLVRTSDLAGGVLRTVSRLLTSGGSILCFHSVTGRDLPSASSVHVPLEILKWSVTAARRMGEVVSLRELVERHQGGLGTAGLVAITFDDAYAALAGPTADFLREEAVHATVFVATEAAESGATFWWDRLEDACARVSPERWRRFEQACGLPEAYRKGQPPEYGPVRPMRQWILREHTGRCPDRTESEISLLESELGETSAHRSMTFEEIAELRALAPIDVGVHTLTHPVLPLLGDRELFMEVAGAHQRLMERFADSLPILAIPYGLYDERTLRVARDAGMQASLGLAGTTLRGIASEAELPRFCLMREEVPWKLHLRLLGIRDRLKQWNPDSRYPVLPSTST